jgi:mannose-1-phosphate guanylyltransferase
VLFEYTSVGEGMNFYEMVVSPRYCLARNGQTQYIGDDRCPLRWGHAGT